jgi:hypothetical protein
MFSSQRMAVFTVSKKRTTCDCCSESLARAPVPDSAKLAIEFPFGLRRGLTP